MEKITKDQFLTRLVNEYFIGGYGVTIWEGEANEHMGRYNREVFELIGRQLVNYVVNPETGSRDFQRQIVLEKPVFEDLLRDLNGNVDPSDYVVLGSLFKSQELADSREVSAFDRLLSMFSPRKRYEHSKKLINAIGRPDDYRPKAIKYHNKRLSF
jgi:hypothetical protein